MTKFGNRFVKYLKENDEEKEAFNLSLDDDIDAEEFDVNVDADPESTAEVADGDASVRAATAQSEIQAAMLATLNGWISAGDEFLSKLNDSTDPNSIAYAG